MDTFVFGKEEKKSYLEYAKYGDYRKAVRLNNVIFYLFYYLLLFLIDR